jgi:hypothetical protein
MAIFFDYRHFLFTFATKFTKVLTKLWTITRRKHSNVKAGGQAGKTANPLAA